MITKEGLNELITMRNNAEKELEDMNVRIRPIRNNLKKAYLEYIMERNPDIDEGQAYTIYSRQVTDMLNKGKQIEPLK